MSWNTFLYAYHQKHGGLYLGGREDDALLVLEHKSQPLAVDLLEKGGGRSGISWYVRARLPAQLEGDYSLTIGRKSLMSGGVNAVLRAVDRGLDTLPKSPELGTDYGFPEVTARRFIRTNNSGFTKKMLMSLDFRNALLASPEDRVEISPGPGKQGLHLVTAVSLTGHGIPGEDWPLEEDWNYITSYGEEEGEKRLSQLCWDVFFPRLDRLLELTRTARDAVMTWRM